MTGPDPVREVPLPDGWKGLGRNHPCANTAARIRRHVDRYVTGRPAAADPAATAVLHRAADVLDHLAETEPNR